LIIGEGVDVAPPAPQLRDATLTWTSPTGQTYSTTPEPVPTTLHPPGSHLHKGPGPEPYDDYSGIPF